MNIGKSLHKSVCLLHNLLSNTISHVFSLGNLSVYKLLGNAPHPVNSHIKADMIVKTALVCKPSSSLGCVFSCLHDSISCYNTEPGLRTPDTVPHYLGSHFPPVTRGDKQLEKGDERLSICADWPWLHLSIVTAHPYRLRSPSSVCRGQETGHTSSQIVIRCSSALINHWLYWQLKFRLSLPIHNFSQGENTFSIISWHSGPTHMWMSDSTVDSKPP